MMNSDESVIRELEQAGPKARACVVAGSFIALWVSINALVTVHGFHIAKPNDEWMTRLVDFGFRILLEEVCVVFSAFSAIFLIWGILKPRWIVKMIITFGNRVFTSLLVFAGGMAFIASVGAVVQYLGR